VGVVDHLDQQGCVGCVAASTPHMGCEGRADPVISAMEHEESVGSMKMTPSAPAGLVPRHLRSTQCRGVHIHPCSTPRHTPRPPPAASPRTSPSGCPSLHMASGAEVDWHGAGVAQDSRAHVDVLDVHHHARLQPQAVEGACGSPAGSRRGRAAGCVADALRSVPLQIDGTRRVISSSAPEL